MKHSLDECPLAWTNEEEQQIAMVLDLNRRLYLLEDLLHCAETNRRQSVNDFVIASC